jgi:heme A synthase
MKNRSAILVAALALVVIALGAYLTSEIRPLPGSSTPTIGSAPALEQAHRIGGYVLAAATLGLAVWVSNLAGWLMLAAVVAEIFLGGMPVIHALASPICFSLIVAVAVVTSSSWQAGPKRVTSDWGPLAPMGMAIPVLIVMQIGLGAAFRHDAMGVISHIMNAFIVLIIVLIAGVFVVRQHPEHPELRPAALALLITAGVQVLLGFSVYLVLLMSSENNTGLIVTGVLHVVNGALTLAAGVVLAMQMQRNLTRGN